MRRRSFIKLNLTFRFSDVQVIIRLFDRDILVVESIIVVTFSILIILTIITIGMLGRK